MKIKNCYKCKKEIEVASLKTRYCKECVVKVYEERKEATKRWRRENGHTKYKDIVCEVCNEAVKNVYFNTKRCKPCSRLVIREKIKQYQRQAEERWRSLPEEEKARRIKIVSDKYLKKAEE